MPELPPSLRELFNNPQGQLLDYDAYPANQRIQIPRQQHVDIRTFEAEPTTTRATALHFNQFAVDGLNPLTMADLEQDVAIRRGEGWTNGVVERQADRHNWGGITIQCNTGTTVTSSVIPKTGQED